MGMRLLFACLPGASPWCALTLAFQHRPRRMAKSGWPTAARVVRVVSTVSAEQTRQPQPSCESCSSVCSSGSPGASEEGNFRKHPPSHLKSNKSEAPSLSCLLHTPGAPWTCLCELAALLVFFPVRWLSASCLWPTPRMPRDACCASLVLLYPRPGTPFGSLASARAPLLGASVLARRRPRLP